MAYNYSFSTFDATTMARASAVNTKISMKKSCEVAREIQGKKLSVAIAFLERVVEQKQIVEYRRYNTEMPHKRGKGIMSGGYPVNVAKQFLLILHNAKKNAENLNLGEGLRIISCSARQGVSRYKQSRLLGRKMKSTNVEVIVAQIEEKAKKKSTKAQKNVEARE